MNVKQLSIFLENKPGHLQNALKVLADNGFNIRTLTIAEASDFGIVRMILKDAEKAHETLKKNHITSSLTDVLAIEIEDKSGSLFKALETFRKKNLNIEYMYAFTEKRGSNAVMIFRFEDIEAAKKALVQEGYNIVKGIEIIGE